MSLNVPEVRYESNIGPSSTVVEYFDTPVVLE